MAMVWVFILLAIVSRGQRLAKSRREVYVRESKALAGKEVAGWLLSFQINMTSITDKCHGIHVSNGHVGHVCSPKVERPVGPQNI